MHDISRRQILQRTLATAAAVGVAGCSGGESSTADGGEESQSSGSAGGSTPNDSPDPDCSRLTGSPTSHDTSGTPFVFAFDYVDTWALEDPVQGPGGRIQEVASPTVTVDGSTERASVSLTQEFEPLTEADVEEAMPDGSGRGPVVRYEQSFGEATIRFVGFPDPTVPYYETYLPYDGSYYHVTLAVYTSIIRRGDGTDAGELCLDETGAAIQTVRRSLRPNPETTIDEVQ